MFSSSEGPRGLSAVHFFELRFRSSGKHQLTLWICWTFINTFESRIIFCCYAQNRWNTILKFYFRLWLRVVHSNLIRVIVDARCFWTNSQKKISVSVTLQTFENIRSSDAKSFLKTSTFVFLSLQNFRHNEPLSFLPLQTFLNDNWKRKTINIGAIQTIFSLMDRLGLSGFSKSGHVIAPSCEFTDIFPMTHQTWVYQNSLFHPPWQVSQLNLCIYTVFQCFLISVVCHKLYSGLYFPRNDHHEDITSWPGQNRSKKRKSVFQLYCIAVLSFVAMFFNCM